MPYPRVMRSWRIWNVAIGIAMAMLIGANAQQIARPILTPAPGPEPAIHGPRVYGARPGRPFLYRIPSTGLRPIRFSATGLPPSLQLDPATGIVTVSGCQCQREKQPRLQTRGRRYPGANSSDGLERLVFALQPYHQQIDVPSRRHPCRLGDGRLRLSVRQHRRLLDGQARSGVRRRASHAGGDDTAQPRLPRHECADRVHPRERTESGDLHVAGAPHLRGIRRRLPT